MSGTATRILGIANATFRTWFTTMIVTGFLAVTGCGQQTSPNSSSTLEANTKLNNHKPKILFLCTGNSCRSQMGEGWARTLLGDKVEAYSAGIIAKGLNPKAVKVMQEAGVDITSQKSKTTEDIKDVKFDLVITVCGHADESCPNFLTQGKKIHVPFDDPPELAKSAANETEALQHYRRVRDEIREFVTKDLLSKL